MKKYAFELSVFLLFGLLVWLSYQNLIEARKSNKSIEIEQVLTKLDSLKTISNIYESKIIQNRIIHNHYADSIIRIPDSALNSAIHATLERYYYLIEQAKENDTVNVE